jgi:hypothetical protein
MKEKIYIETTVVSYLAARPARDVVLLARQQLTNEFWDWSRNHYLLCCSPLTKQEAARGDHAAAARRLAYLDECSDLSYSTPHFFGNPCKSEIHCHMEFFSFG